jgi:ribosomal protein S27E
MFLLKLVVGTHSDNNTHNDGGGEPKVSEKLRLRSQEMANSKYLKGECQHCGGHIEFPPEAAGTTAECPHCGKATDLLLAAPPTESSVPKRAIVYTVIAAAILIGGLIAAQIALKRAQRLTAQKKEAAAAATAKQAAPSPAADTALKDGFRISTTTLEKTPGSSLVYAVGTIRNETARRRFGVRLEFEILDESGKKVGTAKDYQQTLEPKSEWRFRALVVGSNAASAKLVSITEDQ